MLSSSTTADISERGNLSACAQTPTSHASSQHLPPLNWTATQFHRPGNGPAGAIILMRPNSQTLTERFVFSLRWNSPLSLTF